MSDYARVTRRPGTNKFSVAIWLDNYFGPHHYGVQFPDGAIFDEREHQWAFEDDDAQREIVE